MRGSGNATMRGYGNATMRGSGNATMRGYDNATMRGGPYVTIYRLNGHRGTVSGTAHVITPPNLTGCDAATWLSYHGIEPDENGIVTLFKALDDKWSTDRGFDYSPSATPEAPDWKPNHECGGGLHLSPTPVHAMAYHTDATKFAACPVQADEISVIDQQKIKARRIVAPGCRPVDIDGQPLVVEAESAAS
jgi:hypothetical protein